MSSPIIAPPNGFTDTFLKNLKSQKKEYSVSDRGCKGLRLRVRKNNAKTFLSTIYIDGQRKIFTVGHYPDTSLAEARELLLNMKAKAKNGSLVTDKERKAQEMSEREAREAKEFADSVTVEEVLTEFENKVLRARRNPTPALNLINSEIRGKGREFKSKELVKQPIFLMPIKKVELKHINTMVTIIKKRGAAKQASNLFDICKQFFRWAKVNKYITESPMEDIKKEDWGIIQGEKGDVPLDVKPKSEGGGIVSGLPEIKKLFTALDAEVSGEIRNVIKLLLLTGVRSKELLLAEKSHVSLENKTWYIPKENTKSFNKKKPEIDTSIIIPLSDYCIELFTELMQWTHSSKVTDLPYRKLPYVINNLRVKHKFENYFTIHTLRKTLRTHIAGWCRFEVAEKCLNHSLGQMANVYDHGSMLEERRKALQIWGDKVYRAVYGNETNVIPLRG